MFSGTLRTEVIAEKGMHDEYDAINLNLYEWRKGGGA